MSVDPAMIRRAELRELLDFWESRRESGDPPPKARFAPVDVAPYLSNMIFAEVEAASARIRYREVGIELTRIYGSDVADRYLDEMPRLFRAFAEPAYRDAIARRDAAYGAFRFVENWWIATYERLMLPLVGPDGSVVEVAVAIYPRIVPRRSGR